MAYSWEEIKKVIEKTENEKAIDELSLLEQEERFVGENRPLTEKGKSYLEFLGGLYIGILVGVFSLIFNFIFFVRLLHIEFIWF